MRNMNEKHTFLYVVVNICFEIFTKKEAQLEDLHVYFACAIHWKWFQIIFLQNSYLK